MSQSATPQRAWAAVGKKSGKVLHNLRGQLAIYLRHEYAKADCPIYGEVRRVSIKVTSSETRTK